MEVRIKINGNRELAKLLLRLPNGDQIVKWGCRLHLATNGEVVENFRWTSAEFFGKTKRLLWVSVNNLCFGVYDIKERKMTTEMVWERCYPHGPAMMISRENETVNLMVSSDNGLPISPVFADFIEVRTEDTPKFGTAKFWILEGVDNKSASVYAYDRGHTLPTIK